MSTRLERVLAAGRAFLTVSGLAAIYIDATQPARLAEIAYIVLAVYAIYSLIVLAHLHRIKVVTARHSQVLHGLDIVWVAVLTAVGEGQAGLFLLYFLFVVLAAAYRWGFRATVATAAITAAVYLSEATIVRATYLLIAGVLLGYLAEREKQLRIDVERTRVARDLHDGTIQALLGIEMKLEAFRRTADRISTRDDAEMSELQRLLRNEVHALRDLTHALRPVEIDSAEQLPHVLAAIVGRFERDTGISARLIVQGERFDLPASVALELVKIVQEALVNVRKHSRARNVLVRLTADRRTCNLVIEDDGQGFAFEGRLTARELQERRVGPAIIRERARIAGAHLAVDSPPGAGARLELAFTGGQGV